MAKTQLFLAVLLALSVAARPIGFPNANHVALVCPFSRDMSSWLTLDSFRPAERRRRPNRNHQLFSRESQRRRLSRRRQLLRRRTKPSPRRQLHQRHTMSSQRHQRKSLPRQLLQDSTKSSLRLQLLPRVSQRHPRPNLSHPRPSLRLQMYQRRPRVRLHPQFSQEFLLRLMAR